MPLYGSSLPNNLPVAIGLSGVLYKTMMGTGGIWYLKGGNPMVAKIFESYQLTCVDESDAHYKLFAYYTYHGAPELYDIAVPMAVIPESRVMEFI